ncbi:Mov34/MPN/PAD-1 family protein [Methanobacterium alcaliphilum]|uniref:Mov34/MPN/PAD-1 family protein n=1 Tax=Methanobacterium alcaliphilum TaxID=392018 RepID=UPI002009F1FB|nr:Mov34/MPN/PAD-1 family protein [Methanobacterium alcaliphilum]MCK9150483.1 Mov34/MPN/PAD-1 family protein [Methanobacterium alcaliphilum]
MSSIKFKSNDNKFILEIREDTLSNFIDECKTNPNNETGGILVGYYSNDNTTAFIQSITGPPIDSEIGKTTFKRGIDGLIEILDEKWKSGYYYIGEWHFHPNSSPQPSTIDDEQMETFSYCKTLKCPEPILFIIGMNSDQWEFSVNVYKKGNRIPLDKQS